MNFDVIIIGGGAAGISAALWCAELNLTALLLEASAELGGQLLWTHNAIKNHLGSEAENGRELRDIFVKQVENRKFIRRLESKITAIDFSKKSLALVSGEEFSAETLIIATGISRRNLNVEGEEKFKDKGIIESGKRDADLIKDKKVCIVGGGDAAFENALILAETASQVTLVHRGKSFRARAEFVEPAQNNPKINILTETIVKKIVGGERVEAVELENLNTKEIFRRDVEAVLRRIGVEPNTELLRGQIDLDERGYIKINHNCETSVAGIFAVGDVANPVAPTVSSAVGMGATAAKAIFALLNS
ncbi:MAG: NAD(P)/FAD-dependent oxidoreductase [Pyrinomonadaceae bacterium]|nr:NAD(P)/FAD-dependent oxidoreductase [Pyrinomonadaceae bacterium]